MLAAGLTVPLGRAGRADAAPAGPVRLVLPAPTGPFEQWLARHAPGSRTHINPPADPGQIAAVAATLGVDLPDDLRRWWSTANGVSLDIGCLIPRYSCPISTEDALQRWRMHLEVQYDPFTQDEVEEIRVWLAELNAQPAGVLHADNIGHWLPLWLPVAIDGGGGGYFMDLRGGPLHGCLVHFTRDGEGREPRWSSMADMWAEVARRLDETAAVGDDGRIWIEGL